MLSLKRLLAEAKQIETELKPLLDIGNRELLPHLKGGIVSRYFFSSGGQLTEHPHHNFGYALEFPRKRWAYVNLVVSISVIRFEDGPKVFGNCYWEWPLVRLKENGWINWNGQAGDLEVLREAIPAYFAIAISRVRKVPLRNLIAEAEQPAA